MSCFHPVPAVRLQNGDVRFVSRSTVDAVDFKLPCGQCVGCRLEYSRQWAIRCLDEKAMHKENSFLTMTLSEESIALHGRSLSRRVFPLFVKRLRKELSPMRVRYFYCGEYTQKYAPHYHALIFGYGFPDRQYWCKGKSGMPLYVSSQLERLWPFGYSYVGDVDFESAAYVARYVLKKVSGDRDPEDRLVMKDTGEVLLPEFVNMSRGSGDGSLMFDGGIGSGWYKQFSGDVYPHGNRVVRGRDMRPPRFYDKLFAVDDPIGFEELQFNRVNSLDRSDNVSYRLVAKEKVVNARLKLFPRD